MHKKLSLGTSGIFLIDKPSGMTSHRVVNQVRRITGIRKVGHTGTLDPLATGLLILLVGKKFTKQQSQFLKQDKTYLCQAKLGITTDTYDIEGKILHKAEWDQLKKIRQQDLENIVEIFEGEIEQTVPAFSAVKIKGQKLYQLARKNQIGKIKLPSRKIKIHSLKLTEFKKNEKKRTIEYTFEVNCSSGTYIRSLVHDIGQALKVGSTVIALRRTKIGDLKIEQAVQLDFKNHSCNP